MLVYWN